MLKSFVCLFCTYWCLSLFGCAAISNEGMVDFRRTDSSKAFLYQAPTAIKSESKESPSEQKDIDFDYGTDGSFGPVLLGKTGNVPSLPEGEKPEGEKPEGEKPEGETTEGETTEGETTEGETTEGETTEGETTEGETTEKLKSYQQFDIKNFPLSETENTLFGEGDSLSLHLRSAYIKEYTENVVAPYITKSFTRQWGETTGEIAIVANAFEQLSGNELSFEDMRGGRVVFYSNDVHKGQFLNFNNMPIYGPLNFSGAPFAFRVAIYELDVVSSQAKAMLGTLAQVGARAYPPASPVLEVLNGLGNTFLDGDQTDTEFRYTMVLDPKGGAKNIKHFTLQTGNYVLIRTEDRRSSIPWDELMLDENEAVVYWKNHLDEKNGKPKRFTDESYLVVEINKNVSNIGVQLAQNNFSGLINVLEREDKQKASSWRSTNDALVRVAIQKAQIINFDRAKTILNNLSKTDDEVPSFEKREQAKELLRMIATSVNDQGVILDINTGNNSEQYSLSEDQVNYLLGGLRRSKIIEITSSNYENFGLIKIHKAFKPSGDPTKQQEILEVIAPLGS